MYFSFLEKNNIQNYIKDCTIISFCFCFFEIPKNLYTFYQFVFAVLGNMKKYFFPPLGTMWCWWNFTLSEHVVNVIFLFTKSTLWMQKIPLTQSTELCNNQIVCCVAFQRLTHYCMRSFTTFMLPEKFLFWFFDISTL